MQRPTATTKGNSPSAHSSLDSPAPRPNHCLMATPPPGTGAGLGCGCARNVRYASEPQELHEQTDELVDVADFASQRLWRVVVSVSTRRRRCSGQKRWAHW